MSEAGGGSSSDELFARTCESIREQIAGSALALADGAGAPAIDRFGPAIVDCWSAWLKQKSESDQKRILEQLSDVDPAVARRRAIQLLSQSDFPGDENDRKIVAEYLASIPGAIRAFLVEDPTTGRQALPATITFVDEPLVRSLLPHSCPPYPAGHELAGTPYILDEVIGNGGFGTVYRARNRFEQHAPPRALKFCMNRRMAASLNRERQILDKLMMAATQSAWSEHVVKLLGHSLDADRPFLVYEFVAGGSLPNRLALLRQRKREQLPPAQVLGIVRQVASGLAFAHRLGFVHRDVKPANVLVSGNLLKVTDFGIGGVIASDASRSSQIGASAVNLLTAGEQSKLFRGSGTPLYMSPEQRRGDVPDPRHDVYSLGVMWYQLLVGDVTRQLHAGWREELIDETQAPPEQVEAIQCCVGYHKNRPADASALLEILPESRKVQAPPPVAPTPVPPAPTGELLRIEKHRRGVSAVRLFRNATCIATGSEDATIATWTVDKGQELARLRQHESAVTSIDVASDDARLVSADADGTILVWDLATAGVLHQFSTSGVRVNSVCFSPAGLWVLAGLEDNTAVIWNLKSGKILRRFAGHSRPVRHAIFAPDGRSIVTAGMDRSIRVWDVKTGELFYTLKGHAEPVRSVSMPRDGKTLVSSAMDAAILVWDLQARKQVGRLEGFMRTVESVVVSPDGTRAFAGGWDGTVRLFDLAACQEIVRFEGHKNWVTSVAIAADARTAVSGSTDSSVRLWGLPSEPPRTA